MGLTFGHDDDGGYVVLDCDTEGCPAHVAIRPISGQSPTETAYEAAAVAQDEGWWVIGWARCPDHALLGFELAGLHVVRDGSGRPVALDEAVKPEAVATAAQRGLTAVH